MKQHINWKIKYQYVKRYILKEKITSLKKELSLKNLISKNHNNANHFCEQKIFLIW